MPREQSEAPLRDLLVRVLCDHIGEPGSLRISAAPSFAIKESFGGGRCCVEGQLEYVLPDSKKLCHKTDILLTQPSGKKIAIELKFLSSVTDQFKARAYDMLHLKQTLGSELCAIMVYVHMPGRGISTKQAEAICYPFDHFIGIQCKTPQDLTAAGSWTQLIETLTRELQPQNSRVLSNGGARGLNQRSVRLLGVYLVSIPGEHQMDWPEPGRPNRNTPNSLKYRQFYLTSFVLKNLRRAASENPTLTAS